MLQVRQVHLPQVAMKGSFTRESFQKAFADVATFRESVAADGKSKVLGESKLIKLECKLGENDKLLSATLQFPFFLRDQESNRKITALAFRFLDLCLPSSVTPQTWIQQATSELTRSEEKVFLSEQGGLSISLLQMKPDLMFFLTAERKKS